MVSGFDSIERGFDDLESMIDARFIALDGQIRELDGKMEEGFEGLNDRFDDVDERFDELDAGLHAVYKGVSENRRELASLSDSVTKVQIQVMNNQKAIEDIALKVCRVPSCLAWSNSVGVQLLCRPFPKSLQLFRFAPGRANASPT